MIHLFAHQFFAQLVLFWLSKEMRRQYQPRKYFYWMIANACFGLLGLAASLYDPNYWGNFALHFIGGGMATACTFMYLQKNLGFQLNWRLQLGALFLFVSAFGCMNELFEFAVDAGGFVIMSFDRMDTWRDILANTSGAFSLWLGVHIYNHYKDK